ncbi:MAG: SpoIIE family protein phosphatase [Crocinitomicaceae bacterium]|nr:SpoIIE family protein phosphatase [Crocinitomicaceae bacterium]
MSSFDGEKFTNYSDESNPRQNQSWCLENHPDGGILVGTSTGIDLIKNGKRETFFVLDTNVNENAMVRALNYDSKGTLWIGGQHGLHTLSPEKKLTKITDAYVAIGWAEDADGRIWFGSWSNFIGCFYNDSLYRYDVGTPVNDIDIDSDGNLWMATWEFGLAKFNPVSGQILYYGSTEGLGISTLWTVLADHEDNIWAGSYGTGIGILRDQKFAHISEYNGLINPLVNALVQDSSGNIWAATEGGVTCLKTDGTSFHFTQADGLENTRVRDILVDYNGHIWFVLYGGGTGILEYDGTTVYSYPIGSGFSIMQASDSSFYYGSDGGGAIQFDHGLKLRNYSTSEWERNYVLFEDSKKNIWQGKERYGWAVIENFAARSNLLPPYYYTRAGSAICEDDKGYVWINLANQGIYRTTYESGKIVLHDSIRIADGLSSTEIRGLGYNNHFLWITSPLGLSRLNLEKYYANRDLEWKHYFAKDGFKGEATAQMLFMSDGRIAIPSTKGILILDESKDREIKTPPITVLENVLLFHQEVDWKTKGYELKSGQHFPDKIELNYTENHLTFIVNGISFNNHDNVTYLYILEGFDKEWSAPTSHDEIVYTNIPPGEYTFRIKSANKDGYWDESPAEISVLITPPFWQTWWFRISAILILLTALYLFMRWRNSKLIRDKKNLEEKVKIRTVQLDNAFQEIRQKNEEITDSISYAKRIQKAILPPSRIAKKLLGDNFIFYRPKDIVAGDFYWLNEKNNMTLCAVADCTGHGVPGAMVSVVCNSALNRAIREFELTNPADILNKVRELVIETFAQSEEEVKDGMDITLISLQKNTISNEIELNYAGANNPLWIFRKGKTEIPVTDKITTDYFENNDWTLIELKPDKQPVGKFINEKPFSNINFKIQKDDLVYLFSDGFADQFGGEKGKKMKNTNFKTILMQNLNLEMDSQMKEIEKEFIKWRGDFEQLDDVCVVGVKF